MRIIYGRTVYEQKNYWHFGCTFGAFAIRTMSVFAADDRDTEYEYTISFSYYYVDSNGKKGNDLQTKSVTLWASSVADAHEQAIRYCKDTYGELASCGAPRVTGRSRPAN
ncbi:hypothetical protein FACS1894190_13950 [Spirochaetia bacterium]|nr:hypothetical protein FACS1894190_13950 [Spirochaetia bacterium]